MIRIKAEAKCDGYTDKYYHDIPCPHNNSCEATLDLMDQAFTKMVVDAIHCPNDWQAYRMNSIRCPKCIEAQKEVAQERDRMNRARNPQFGSRKNYRTKSSKKEG